MSIALYPHKSGLGLMEPVAQINHNVAILFGAAWYYRKVTRYVPIPPFQFLNLGAIAAQATSAKLNATNLDVKSGEFAQYRWWVLDNIQARLWLPASTANYSLRSIGSVVDPNTPLRDPCLHLTEFFVWEDERPDVDAVNIMDYALAQARCVAMGYRFQGVELPKATVEAILAGKEPCVYIMAEGMK